MKRRSSTADVSLSPAERFCVWCEKALPRGKRRHARTCSQPCRQALCRFEGVAARVATHPSRGPARRFAYADPPYPGLARRYYRSKEVDHEALVARLVRDFPDGWALSTSAAALQNVLALCPSEVRVCAWVKGARASSAWFPSSAWEPLIVCGGRPRRIKRQEDLDDTLVCSSSSRARSHPRALVGMKPARFCVWMFEQLGARAGDELVDLFPGSGAVTRAWHLFAGATRHVAAAAATLPSKRRAA